MHAICRVVAPPREVEEGGGDDGASNGGGGMEVEGGGGAGSTTSPLSLTTYVGVLTRSVAEAVWELDDDPRTKLFLTHSTFPSVAKGLRLGALLRASNVAPLHVCGRLEGFVCTARSQLS